jgi:hypothetical protein
VEFPKFLSTPKNKELAVLERIVCQKYRRNNVHSTSKTVVEKPKTIIQLNHSVAVSNFANQTEPQIASFGQP